MRNASDESFELAKPPTVGDINSAIGLVRGHLDEMYRQAAADAHHGNVHGKEVEQRLVSTLAKIRDGVTSTERLALQAGALLHDVGYMRYTEGWSADRREHIAAGLDIAEHVLSSVRLFAQNSQLRLIVCYLVAHHDDTNYQYPSSRWGGIAKPADLRGHAAHLKAFEESLTAAARRRLMFLLKLLQEADALAATGLKGAERTLQYSTARGVSIFGSGNPTNAWCWEESAAGNVLLAAKRALVDACTEDGRATALKGYRECTALVERLCREHGKPFVPETALAFFQRAVDESPRTDAHLTVNRYLPWDDIEAELRDVTLMVDRSLKPYADAKIELRRRDLSELHPLATYVLSPRLEQLQRMQTQLCRQYALSIFDLAGLVDYDADGELYRQMPPLVERYYEPTENRMVSAIVDGLHRVSLARRLQLNEMWVVEISEVPERYPVVSLPLRWEDVQVVDSVPTSDEKRRFRYTALEEFPDVSDLTSVDVTASNYLYFFYRDLSGLGSGGIREPGATPSAARRSDGGK